MKQLKKLMEGRTRSTIIMGVALVAIAALVPTLAFSGGSFITKKTAKKLDTKTLNKAVAKATAASLPNDIQYVRSDTVTVPDSNTGSAIAKCPAGYKVVGGGGNLPSPGVNSNFGPLRSIPSNGTAGQAGTTAWEFQLSNHTGVARNIRAYAICVKATKTTANYAEGADAL